MLEDKYGKHGEQFYDVETGKIVELDELSKAINESIQEEYAKGVSYLVSLGMKIPLRLVKARNGESYNIINIKERFHFTKIFKTDVRFVLDEFKLSVYSRAFLYSLLPYLYFPTNTVIIDGKNPEIDDLMKLVGIGKSKIYEVMNELENLNIIKREKVNGKLIIYFNPFLHSCGLVDTETYKLFENSIFNPLHDMTKGVQEVRT
nr:hypothetical protein [Mycobacterium sp. E3298]